jgi:nucleoside-diphosphate-sugar epimerase
MNRDAQAPLRVLVLGGSGHIGRRWLALQAAHAAGPLAVQAVGASRHARSPQERTLDVRDGAQLRLALQGMDAVINAVAGSQEAIVLGTERLCEAALALGVRVVHLSTQSVYGPFEGTVHESMPLDPRLGWYGRAKCEAEMQVRESVRCGGQAVVLRPGCVWGPGSWLWVGRLAQWLRDGRLGDLGAAGDGWSNLVHVDDVCQAISAALHLPLQAGHLPAFNLAAPDSPRWNEVFVDLALTLGAPVRRLSARTLWLDSHLVSPPLKAAQLLCRRLGLTLRLPEPLPPGLVRLWAQQMRLDSQAAQAQLGLRWTPYEDALKDSVRWVHGTCDRRDRALA